MEVDQEDRHRVVPQPEEGRDLILEMTRRPDLFNPPQQVRPEDGDQVIADFAADSKAPP